MTTRKRPELKPLLVERMKQLLQKEEDFKNWLDILNQPTLNSIRCNTLKISPEKLKERLENKGWKINQPFKDYPEIMVIEGKFDNINNENNKKKLTDLDPGELGRSLEHLLGYYYVQEIASMLSVIALNPKPHERVLDLCAAPGSKTTQIAAKMKNTGLLIANDLSIGRIRILATNLERCGVSNVIVTRKQGFDLCRKFAQKGILFDKILLDAPCSGEGTLRNSISTYSMWNINSVNNLSRIQKALITHAIEVLKKGGEIIYSTCTHSPEENEEIIDFVLKNFENMEIESLNLPSSLKCRQGLKEWNGKEYDKSIEKSCRIYPQDNNTEGFFITKLRKKQ